MTPEQARERVAAGEGMQQIADEAGVSYMTVYRWVKPEYRKAESEKEKLRARKVRASRTPLTGRLAAKIQSLENQLLRTKSELENCRKRAAKAELRRNQLLDEVSALREELAKRPAMAAPSTPFNLTELHEWWLATKSPAEIVRIASGLSGWEQEEMAA